MKILVTGGAGFIGSHLIDALCAKGHHVVCVDDLSLGRIEHIAHHLKSTTFEFIQLNILDESRFDALFSEHRFDCVFHMAANSDIQEGATQLRVDLEKTFMTTFITLNCMQRHGVQHIAFASSSAVYGERSTPLREDSGPLQPISFYGAAKLAAEAYISAFCENFDMRAWIFRFPNVVGERATHGVIFDFIQRLRENPHELLILGDGSQEKPYLYVKDLVSAMLFVWERTSEKINCYNIGVSTTTRVSKIADIVVEEMGLQNVQYRYTGGDRGWKGDVPWFLYDLHKITELGWTAQMTSDDAVRHAVRALLGTYRE
ncbi:MAG: NAD-dependent epimerase/dehydratase family protein [Desulfobacterota bacterium]|nr:NAD-dependent epimerase/dehydratase family protein [Thermodesulfobacteriota bacterium]